MSSSDLMSAVRSDLYAQMGSFPVSVTRSADTGGIASACSHALRSPFKCTYGQVTTCGALQVQLEMLLQNGVSDE